MSEAIVETRDRAHRSRSQFRSWAEAWRRYGATPADFAARTIRCKLKMVSLRIGLSFVPKLTSLLPSSTARPAALNHGEKRVTGGWLQVTAELSFTWAALIDGVDRA